MELRMKTIKYSKEKRLELRKKGSTLQKEIQDLDYKICNTDFETLDRNIFVEYEAAKEELKKIYEHKGKEAIFRSKVKWLEQGEKPTKYFFNLEKTNYEKKLIREVKLENGDKTTQPKQIEKELEKFYSNMYTSKNNLNIEPLGENKSFESFVEGIEIPQLNAEERDSLEYDFTFEELKEALGSFSDNKTPGEDGFTKEFYESFYDLIWRDLLNSYNAAFQSGSLCISQRRGIITLIPKADGDLSELSNWRPISLLNIDYKILTKALAKRIEQFLPKLINSDQTGFVKGRYIGQNIRLLSDVMEYLNANKTSGLLLFIDFEKAFDSLEWDFIVKALNVFNFGPNVKRWISIFYNGVQSAVINGGFLTNYFNISRGVRQGCPLSPLLFILAAELLAAKIRQEPNCRGLSLPDDQEVKISQFADDTTIITKSVESLKPYLQILDCFGIISGLKLNKKKTKAMWIGSMKDSNLKVLDFKTTKEPIKVLGIHLSYNKNKCTEENFYVKINKMKTKLNLWLSRDLTIYGGLPCHGCISSCKGSNNSNTWDCYKSGCEECLQRCNIHNCEAIPSVAVSIRTVSLPALQSVSKAALSSSASASLTLSISPSSSQPPPPPPSSLLPYQPPSPTLLSSPFSLFPSPSPSSRPLTLPSPSLSPSQSSLSSPPPSPSPLEPSAPPSSISSPSSSAAAASATPPPPSRPLTLPSPSLSPSQSSLSSPPPSPSPLELSAPPSSISSPSSSAAAVSTTPPSSSSSSTTEELAIKFISTLNKTDVQQANSLQDVVNLLENTIELYKNKSIHEVQMNTTSKEELKAFVFKTAFAFERFALKYGQYHLSDSVPMINNVHSKLVLRIERVFRRNASDFHLEGSEHQNIINIPSNNFDNNGSVLLGIVYTDIHELLEASQFNSKARTTRQLDTVIMAATMDPKPKQLLQNVALKFRNLKAVDETRYCVFWNGYSEKNPDGWSAEGCHAMKSASNWDETVCSCNHMTHFAVLLDYGDNLEITEKDEKILRIVTYVGLALSIMGLILTTISYIHLTDVHQPLSQIRVNLAGSLGAGQVIFLAGINATENTGACVGVAALMQYFLMVAFCWMLVEGIYLYLLVVKVYNINNKMAIYYVMSWGFPVVMVTISLSIAAGKEGIKSYVNDK
ncbi:hypothetical protein ACROYT_G032418 [Oculina patagonica]